MAEIMGTVTSVKRYLSPEKIELKVSPDLGGESSCQHKGSVFLETIRLFSPDTF